jgi:hypothetical protein
MVFEGLKDLTPAQRRLAAAHERGHVELAYARGHMNRLEYHEALVRVSAFERGDEVAELAAPTAYDLATDAAVSSALAELGKRNP